MLSQEVLSLIGRGALFVVNHSAGKDSQAMLIFLLRYVPRRQILIVHADLGEVEWPGNVEHIQATAPGLPLVIAKASKTFITMVEHRFATKPDVPSFPDKARRQCTSDLKRDPINREIRRFLKAHPEFNGLVVNCMGMRAQESTDRAKLETFKRQDKYCVQRRVNARTGRVIHAGREWFEWLPIHDLSTLDVFAMITEAGQQPHPIYALGMTRLSCVFCIMASVGDLTTAARLNPALYVIYVRLERKTGYRLSMSRKSLEEITGISLEEAEALAQVPEYDLLKLAA